MNSELTVLASCFLFDFCLKYFFSNFSFFLVRFADHIFLIAVVEYLCGTVIKTCVEKEWLIGIFLALLVAWILEIKHRSQHHSAFCRGTSCAAGSSRAVVSGRVGAHGASEPQCCGTPKFKQTNHLPHLLELSEGFSLWETTCHQSKVREKRSMKRKQVLGMLRPSRALITPTLPECPSVHILSP